MRRSTWWVAGLSSLLLLLVWPAGVLAHASPTPLFQEEEPVIHVVQPGETLFGIAQEYGTTVEAIAAANGITDPSRIAVNQQLIIPTARDIGEPQTLGDPGSEGSVGPPDTTYHTYAVLPGDTLAVVARRFDVTVAAVAALNGVLNPASLPVGQQLQVPGQYVGRLHRVTEGETALGLALRYDLPPWGLLVTNGLSSPGALLPGERVVVPAEVLTGTLPLPWLGLDVGPLPALQGHTVRVRAELTPGAGVQGVFDDQVLQFAVQEDVHYALFGVHALADPGVYTLSLLATDASGDEVYLTDTVEVVDGGYNYEEIVLPAERDALLAPEALATERVRLAEIKPVFNPERYWDGSFLRPLDTELTSAFGTRRLYKSPSYQSYGYHEGTDFDGEVGTPVYAPATGVVVLAEPLYVRGNAIVIDHGWGIYTGYWHLSQIDVVVGQQVAPGDQIGLMGDTGLSTGAHLHWDFWVNGTNVNGLQWTEYLFP
jgi:murein DD-endopeptidase MepM/ murein hydrolase activator NlpD